MDFADVGLRVSFVDERESNSHYTARILHLTDTAVSMNFRRGFTAHMHHNFAALCDVLVEFRK